MLKLLDDPSPLVRRSLADALAPSPAAPAPVIIALASDQPQIAAPIYALSPLLIDADLVDGVATGGDAVQAAIASRAVVPSAVAAALAELGNAEACQILAEKRYNLWVCVGSPRFAKLAKRQYPQALAGRNGSL